MKLRYVGDSYDIVKQSLLRWLGSCGKWAAHPMFTEHVSPDDVAAFSRVLGVPLLSCDVLESNTTRDAYFAGARTCPDHLFLDPDIGFRLSASRSKESPSYLFGPEIISIVSKRPTSLTLVFDQSLARGREREQLKEKLAYLDTHGIASFAYVSHACFILMGICEGLVKKAFEAVQAESGLPTNRFVTSYRTT